ncbi:hypothetical protein FF1_014554 [Malus domestica]
MAKRDPCHLLPHLHLHLQIACSGTTQLGAVVNPTRFSKEKVYEVVLKFRQLDLLDKAYDRCGEICADFYLGTFLMTPERRRAV